MTWKQKHRQRQQAFIDRYKMMFGCRECGYKDNVKALELDHIIPLADGKAPRVNYYKNCGRARLKDEMRKCQILCSNCHSIKTRSKS